MCSLAPPTALGLGFHATAGARASLGRRRGAAPAACGAMARASSAPTQKRSRDGEIGDRERSAAAGEAPVVPAHGQQRRLQERMREELDAIRVLHRKAVLLSKSKTTSPSKRAPEAARQSTEPVKRQQRPVVQRATPLPAKPSVAKPVDKAREIAKRRRLEETTQARDKCNKIEETKQEVQEGRRQMEELAREREECRRLVLAMEMAALPDETVYPRDLEELGIAPFEYAVTRTRRQARSQARILVGVAY